MATLRHTWEAQESEASQNADEAVKLEEDALTLETAGHIEEVRHHHLVCIAGTAADSIRTGSSELLYHVACCKDHQSTELAVLRPCTQASAAMARAEELHSQVERLRLEADRTKAAVAAREKEAESSMLQAQLLVQGLHNLEHAAHELEAELQQAGRYDCRGLFMHGRGGAA